MSFQGATCHTTVHAGPHTAVQLGLATLRCKSSHLLAAIHRCRTASTCYNVALLLLQFDDSGGKKRDPFATRAAERLGRFVCRGSGRVVGTMDAGGRRVVRDEELVDAVYEAQGKRNPRSRTRGGQQTPAEVALRMLILKHVRNWSYEVLEREVRANVVYRSFCRIGTEKVPDAKTLVRLGQAIGGETIRELHDRIVALARERRVVQGRKMRVDTTVVETNVHYPTDSGLLNDGARVLTRTMKKIEQKAGRLKK